MPYYQNIDSPLWPALCCQHRDISGAGLWAPYHTWPVSTFHLEGFPFWVHLCDNQPEDYSKLWHTELREFHPWIEFYVSILYHWFKYLNSNSGSFPVTEGLVIENSKPLIMFLEFPVTRFYNKLSLWAFEASSRMSKEQMIHFVL